MIRDGALVANPAGILKTMGKLWAWGGIILNKPPSCCDQLPFVVFNEGVWEHFHHLGNLFGNRSCCGIVLLNSGGRQVSGGGRQECCDPGVIERGWPSGWMG